MVTTTYLTIYHEFIIFWGSQLTEMVNFMERTYHLGEVVCVVNQAVQSNICNWGCSFGLIPVCPF